MMVSTSGNKSLAISTEAMLPRVQRARPTVYWLGWFKSLRRRQLPSKNKNKDKNKDKDKDKNEGRVVEWHTSLGNW